MTTATKLDLEIRPLDTLMFRDGRPFNQGDPGAAEATSVFPPYPSTVAGMVRALLPFRDGDKPSLSFSPPVLFCENKGALYPAPRSILSSRIPGKPFVQLVPGAPRETDVGKGVCLPAPLGLTEDQRDDAGLKEIENGWITLEGLNKVLKGETPVATDFGSRDELWKTEPRVGVGIDNMTDGAGAPVSNLDKRRPIDGALYAATHTRLERGVTLRVTVESLSGAELSLPLAVLGAAGGEHRLAEFSKVARDDAPMDEPRVPNLVADGDGKIRFAIYHAAPCFLHPMPEPNKVFGSRALNRPTPERKTEQAEALKEATVVSACLGKALMIGGWSLNAKGPVGMRPAIPAGSVWFLEAPKEQVDIAAIKALHGKRIGEGLGRGFGQIFIGAWNKA